MKMKRRGEAVLIEGLRQFNLRQTFECGQAFRWLRNEDGSYSGIVGNRVLTLLETMGEEEGTVNLELMPCTLSEAKTIWYKYFDLDTNYGDIQEKLSENDEVLKMATQFGAGIRLLHQDLWEMILTFILSANNNIPRISASLEALAQTYGKPVGQIGAKTAYSLPTPDVLSVLEPSELRVLGLGYRDKYVVETAKMLAAGLVQLEGLPFLETAVARKQLCLLPGVGPKVAECILLFALGRRDAFPVDTWVKKVMTHFYCEKDSAIKDISRFAEERFGNLGGYAQQYLFYYARENRLGQ